MDDTRRTAEADADDELPLAATVILARDSAEGPEVLLLERPQRGAFPGAWVFPGGKLDAADAEGLGADASHEAAARRAAVRETREETALIVRADDLVPVSRWTPPPGIALRIRTWFFATRAPQGALVLQQAEAVASQWIRPADALERHGRGELILYPPTWVTLHGLVGQPHVDALLAEARLAGLRHFETRMRPGGGAAVLFWREDAEYAGEGEDEASGARHRLEIGALPWIYTREG